MARGKRVATKAVNIEGQLVDASGELQTRSEAFVGLSAPHEDSPSVKPYVFDAGQLRDLRVALEHGIDVIGTGPTGCGKTSLFLAVAARLNQPVVRFNFNGESRTTHIVGMQKPVSKEGVLALQFEPGALVKAMREGYWVIFDELDAAPPAVLMTLQPVLEEGNPSLYIPETGERIDAEHGLHERFRVMATGNTIGYRATQRSRHAGTSSLNSALLDRFGMVLACDYPARAQEINRVLANVPGCDRDYVDGICRVAEECRSDTAFRSDFSTRRLVQWAQLAPSYDYDMLRTLDLAVARKFESPVDAKVVREVTARIFGYSGEE